MGGAGYDIDGLIVIGGLATGQRVLAARADGVVEGAPSPLPCTALELSSADRVELF
jgi:hypothetical protein